MRKSTRFSRQYHFSVILLLRRERPSSILSRESRRSVFWREDDDFDAPIEASSFLCDIACHRSRIRATNRTELRRAQFALGEEMFDDFSGPRSGQFPIGRKARAQ